MAGARPDRVFRHTDADPDLCSHYDRLQNGKFNKVFVYGSLLLFISYPLRMVLSGTDAWLAFANWVVQFSLV